MAEGKALITIRGIRGSPQNTVVVRIKVPKEYCEEAGTIKLDALPEGVDLIAVRQCEYCVFCIHPSDYGFGVEICVWDEMTEAEREEVACPWRVR